jgi:hypothetical protein
MGTQAQMLAIMPRKTLKNKLSCITELV